MTQPLVFDTSAFGVPEQAPMRRPARAILAGIAVIIIVAVLSLLELGALALVAVASSAMNHGASS